MTGNWLTVTLEEVCEFLDRRGVTPEKLGSRFRSEGFRVISAKNIKGRQIDTGTGEQRYVDEPTYRKWMKSPLLVDDVLLTSEAPLGEPAYVGEELSWCLGQRLFGIRTDKSKVYGKFLFYALQASPVRDDLLSRATGATAQGIRQSELKRVGMPLPSLSEQRGIVSVLDEAFAGLATAQANAEQNILNARALFENQLRSVFMQRGAGWTEKLLSEVCEISSVLVDPRDDEHANCLHVGGANIESKTGRLIELKTAREEGLISGKFSFDETMVLYSKIRPYLMKVARPNFQGLCSADIYPLSVKAGQIDRDYLFYLLLSPEFTEYANAGSARAGMPKVNRDHLFTYRVHLPSAAKQRQFAANLDALHTETRQLESIYQKKIDALDVLKKSLLNQAFTGQL